MIEFGDYTLIETTVLKYLFEHLVNVFRVQNTNNSFGIWQLSPRQRIAYKIVFCLFVFLKFYGILFSLKSACGIF